MTSRRQFLNAMLNAGWRRATPNWWTYTHPYLNANLRDEAAWQYFVLFRIVPTPDQNPTPFLIADAFPSPSTEWADDPPITIDTPTPEE